MEPSQTREITPVDNGCTNGCNAPFGVRCSVCNTEKRQPSMILCQCANHHRSLLQLRARLEMSPTAAIMDQLVVDE